jgi:uncharacterized protein YwqG
MTSAMALLRELVPHALAKRGAEMEIGRLFDEGNPTPCVEVRCAHWGAFLDVYEDEDDDGRLVLRFPVTGERLAELMRENPRIRESSWGERDGHVYGDAPLDEDIPVELFKSILDEAHAIVFGTLDSRGRRMIELSELRCDDRHLIELLIDLHDLSSRRTEIQGLARPEILVRTGSRSESRLPLGCSRLGGTPDLPEGIEWPVFSDGRPLAFLAQFDLAEVAAIGTPVVGLPQSGLLSVFSAWGWTSVQGFCPVVPDSGWEEQEGWSVVHHIPQGSLLRPRKQPRGLHCYPAAPVRMDGILSLPNDLAEVPTVRRAWSEDEVDRFERMQRDLRRVQGVRWYGQMSVNPGCHVLGGYACFQQEFPPDLEDSGRRMLLQLGTDANPVMCWAAMGEFTLFADADALSKGRFERLWGDCQGM